MHREENLVNEIYKKRRIQPKLEVIKLDNESLTTIPPDIYNNSDLESLTITKNKHVIILPREFPRLASSLKTLSFAYSKISNLNLIFTLTNLEALDLTNVKLGVLPDEIGNLIHLKYLNLTLTDISTLPNSFVNLQNLQDLRLSNNKFDMIPEVICRLKNLTTLEMSNNQIIVIPDYIKELDQLGALELSNNSITDILPICSLTLDTLDLEFNNIESIPEMFGNLTLLRYVNLSHNNLHELSDVFGELKDLEDIEAESNAIKYISPSLTKLENLKRLILDNNLISDIPHFKNTITIILDDNPIMSSYKNFNIPNHIDPTLGEFNILMENFKDKEQTIINKTNGYINDSILHEQTNPYIVHYETYNGLSYPIITILKGTLLFTARSKQSPTIAESFFHLYKLYDNPTLEKYKENDFENVLTYFFPVPFMAPIVDTDYTTMDMVALSKDIRLLCLLSPSPIERGDKVFNDTLVNDNNNTYYKENVIHECPTREYDLCMSTDLIFGLKLNGYIGIAYSDSPSYPENADIIKEMVGNIDYKKSLLYLSSCFNNAIYKKPTDVSGNNFIERMLDARTHGIPEIVLIPYDIHTGDNNTPEKYAKIYAKNLNYISEKSNKILQHFFIFKYVVHADGTDSFDVADVMETFIYSLDYGSNISKSLQCYPLFAVLNSEFDPDKRNMLLLDDRPVTLDDVSFPNSYTSPPTSYCAFENAKFYEMLEEKNEYLVSVGGSTILPETNAQPFLKSNSLLNTKNNITNTKNNVFILNAEKNKKVAKAAPPKNMKYVSDRIYYNEVAGIPIFAFKRGKKGGNKHKRKNKTKKKMKIQKGKKCKTRNNKTRNNKTRNKKNQK